MTAVLFIVTIPTEEEEERLKTDYITRKIESKSLKSEAKLSNDPKGDTVSVIIESTTPLIKSVHYGDTFPKRRKSESDNLLALDGTGDNVTTANKSQEKNGSVKSMNIEQMNASQSMRKSLEGIRDILSSAKRKTSLKIVNTDLDLPYDACMVKVLKEILSKCEVINAIWTKDLDGKVFQIMFAIEVNKIYEELLKKFNEWGIGDREGSSVTVINCIASKKFTGNNGSEEELYTNSDNKFQEQKETTWDRFMDSVRSRLNVAQVVNNVRQDATITFDFCVLVVCAAILAAFGLVDDSTIFLAASMLISPLMGPIIAAIFGTVIKDTSLRMLGIKNELIGICLALSVGFMFALILCIFDDRYSRGEGLSAEMLSRCDMRSLLVGVFTAVPSGAAAAVAILGGNIGSLVGVAISASLLPPAVNTGMLWALACVYKFFEYDDSRYNSVIKKPIYFENQAAELAILSSISMCLTIINIICIYVMGILMLKIKEIAPITARQNSSFWKHDIKIARHLPKSFSNRYTTDQVLIDEFTNLPKEDQQALGINCDILRKIHVDDAMYQNTWSPLGRANFVESFNENQATVQGLERLYATIHNQKPYRARQFSYVRPLESVDEIGRPYHKLSDHFPRRSTMPTKAMQEHSPTLENITNSSTTLKSNMTTPIGTGDLGKRRKFIVTPAQVDPLKAKGNDSDDDI